MQRLADVDGARRAYLSASTRISARPHTFRLPSRACGARRARVRHLQKGFLRGDHRLGAEPLMARANEGAPLPAPGMVRVPDRCDGIMGRQARPASLVRDGTRGHGRGEGP
jgi:hypothetical protein